MKITDGDQREGEHDFINERAGDGNRGFHSSELVKKRDEFRSKPPENEQPDKQNRRPP